MKINIITLFPEIFEGPLSKGLVGQAVQKKIIEVEYINPRSFTTDIHKSVDDRPYGGGEGMVMLAEPLKKSIEQAKVRLPKAKCIYLSPQGTRLTQKKVAELSGEQELIFLCGRYEGIDQRLVSKYVDAEISLGDYILSGGELAALVVIDSVGRLLPGVLGNRSSVENESFALGMLEYPQFTRPQEFEGQKVPSVLMGGHHQEIARWRYLVSILRTQKLRPDLISRLRISEDDLLQAESLYQKMSPEDRQNCGLLS